MKQTLPANVSTQGEEKRKERKRQRKKKYVVFVKHTNASTCVKAAALYFHLRPCPRDLTVLIKWYVFLYRNDKGNTIKVRKNGNEREGGGEGRGYNSFNSL